MYSNEKKVAPHSPYFIYTPSALARRLFFYPTAIGHFRYLPGYCQKRSCYDSFLYLFVEEGTFRLVLNETIYHVPAGGLVLLNCYDPHEYGSDEGCKILWLHFDGPLAREYYDQITSDHGNILQPSDFPSLHCRLKDLMQKFADENILPEEEMSLQITKLLLPLLRPDFQKETDSSTSNTAIRKTLNYILSHFQQELPLDDLASIAGLSPYHFLRIFKKEVGMTPHQYIIKTRLSTAQYLLTTTGHTVSDIAYEVGFKDESSFCRAFRVRTGLTPLAFRAGTTQTP